MTHSSSLSLQLQRAAGPLKNIGIQPQVAIVLGSGLGDFASGIENARFVPYGDVDGMPVSKVEGHAGRFCYGRFEGVDLLAMQGRVHLYEGHRANDVVFGVRLAIALGARVVILTNAAGGIDETFDAGDLMVIDDHINLTGHNCLVGENDAAVGPRFPDMTHTYDAALGALAEEGAKTHGFSLRHGVYAGMLGPNYETPAEIRMLRGMGAHAVGMSTVLEAIAARHMGARILGISCITNPAAGVNDQSLSHAEVQDVANRTSGRFQAVIRAVLAGLASREERT